MNPSVNIGLCQMPKLLCDVLGEAVERHSGLRLVPESIRLETIEAQVVELGIDTLLVLLSRIDGRCLTTQLMREVPHLKVVVLTREGHEVVFYHPALEPHTLYDPSLGRFLDAIRQSDVGEPMDLF